MQKKFKRILLIDDDQINNELNQLVLNIFGNVEETIVCENGSEALQFLKSHSKENLPELILLDIKMPIMDGFQFLDAAEKMCKDFTKRIPVYILTSSKNEGDIKKANEYDIAGFLNKPLTFNVLEKISQSM
jgi:CheY-like chemotaxis protein